MRRMLDWRGAGDVLYVALLAHLGRPPVSQDYQVIEVRLQDDRLRVIVETTDAWRHRYFVDVDAVPAVDLAKLGIVSH